MNKKCKKNFRLLALVLSLMMVATCLSIPAFAAEDQDASGNATITNDISTQSDAASDNSDEAVTPETQTGDEESATEGETGSESQDSDGDSTDETVSGDETQETVATQPPAQVKSLGLKWSGSTIILSWKSVANASGYEVWRSKQYKASKYYSRIKTCESGTTLKYYDKNKVKTKIYLYKVRAYTLDAEGNKVYGSFSSVKKSGKTATKIPVATYHHFCKSSDYGKIDSYSSLYVTDKKFKAQMRWLKRHGWRTITTDEIADWHSGKIYLPRKSTLITFDDGCISVIKYALPIMKKYNIKGTSFIQGNMTKTKTSKRPRNGYKDYYIGKDIIKKVKKSYPNLEFQSHTWRMHDTMHGKAPVSVMTAKQMKADAMKMYNTFGTTAIAYPWGYSNTKFRNVLRATGVYRVGFKFRDDGYATLKQSRFRLKRFKVYGGQSLSQFTKWYKY